MSDVVERFRAIIVDDEDRLEDIMQAVYTAWLGEVGDFSVVDGGAHRGLHTFPFSRLPGCVEVFAVEANAELIAHLEQEEWMNSKGARVLLVSAALQEDPARKSVTFMQSASHQGRSGISSIFQGDPEVTFEDVTVPATTIDKITAGATRPIRFVKLDLEGGEWNAVRGAERVMKNDRPVLVMEHSVRSPELNGYAKEDYLKLYDDCGYQLLTFAGEPMTVENMHYLWYVWAAPKEDAERIQTLLRAEMLKVVEG